MMKVTKSHGKKLDSHEHAQTCSGREHASEKNGILAQLGEHLPYKQRVTGSSPVGPIHAGVAELADAQDLKSCCGDTVPVRFRSPALHYDL